MLRCLLLATIGVLSSGMIAYADGIPSTERAARCLLKRSDTSKAVYEEKLWTMNVSNEGKVCAISEAFGYQDNGNLVNIKPYESMSLATRPQHGEIVYSSDSRSYIQYRPAAGFVGDDTFGYRLYPGNALRTVTVTVGP